MQWVVELWATGYLITGQPVIQFKGLSQIGYPTLELCAKAIENGDYHGDEMEIIEIVRLHMQDKDAKVTVTAGCREAPLPGEPV